VSVRDLIEKWRRERPVPFDATNRSSPVMSVSRPDTPLGWICLRHESTGFYVALMAGSRELAALRKLTLPDGRWAWAQVALPTRRA
jgi:hypothetical protein